MSSSVVRVTLSEAEKEPSGAVKWKALFDNTNPLTSKVLFRSTHTEEFLPWFGFNQHKDFLYTSISLTPEQNEVLRAIEDQVKRELQEHEWSRPFQLLRSQRIFPRYAGCSFLEKKEDGLLHPVEPDLLNELHNTPEKTLTAAALLQVSGVFFDFSKHTAKLTFKLVSLAFQWGTKIREDVTHAYMSMYGTMATNITTDIIEAAVKAAKLDSLSETNDRDTFVASLNKIRTVNGVRKKLNKLRRDKANEADFLQWAEQEALKYSNTLKAKADREEEKKRALLTFMMRPLPQQGPMETHLTGGPMDVNLFDTDEDDDDC